MDKTQFNSIQTDLSQFYWNKVRTKWISNNLLESGILN